VRLAEAAARQRFGAARVARLATLDPDGRPHLVPVTFALAPGAAGGDRDRLYITVDAKPKTTTRL
jgi:predicted pyridoxine 5'-phosphate oxidase superfamily flavin-nucleotide-binding protein